MTTFQPARPDDRIITVEEAQQRVLAAVTAIGVESVDFFDAQGRILREDVRAPHDVPEGDNSAMDGYAIRATDVAAASKDSPVSLKVTGDVPAGSIATSRVESACAMRIMTGALVPDGADAVVPVELTDAGRDVVRVFAPVSAGANIRRRGEDMRSGDVVLASGAILGAGEIGILAAAQKTTVSVARQPLVAILSTGDELVDVHAARTPGKVVNSNAYALAGLVRDAGGIPQVRGIVRDTREATIAAIRAAADADIVLSSGGVSVGAFDFVKDALDELGAETRFWRVAMKPGKPVVFATLGGRLYFGLPGNPVSCLVAFLLFVRPAMRKAMGQAGSPMLPTVAACLSQPIKSAGDRRTYFRVRLAPEDGQLVAHPMKSQGSGVSTSMVAANGLAYLDLGTTRAEAGERVPVVVFGPIAT